MSDVFDNHEFTIAIEVSKTILYSQRQKGEYKAIIKVFNKYGTCIKDKEDRYSYKQKDFFGNGKFETYLLAVKGQEDFLCELIKDKYL